MLVSKAARNEFASKSMQLMHSLSRRFWYQHYKEVADLPLCARLHASLAEAICDRRSDDAAAASDDLLDYIESFTRATSSSRPGPTPTRPCPTRATPSTSLTSSPCCAPFSKSQTPSSAPEGAHRTAAAEPRAARDLTNSDLGF